MGLIEKTKAELQAIAKKAGLAVRGNKTELVARIEGGKEPDPKKAGGDVIGFDVKPTPIKKTLKARAKAAAKERAALEKRRKKAGSAAGEAQ